MRIRREGVRKMDDNYQIELYYGYQEGDEGIYHAFSTVDPAESPDSSNIADELACLLDTTPEDERFNWDSMLIKIPESILDRIRQEAIEHTLKSCQPTRKEYTMDSFRRMLHGNVIEATGRVASSPKGDACINYSSILTKLIQAAGRLVDYYASDLFISWREVMDDLDFACDQVYNGAGSPEQYEKSYLFGFREYGVDHASAVLAKYNNAGMYNNRYGAEYRELWRLDLCVNRDGEIRMCLYQVNKAV